VTGGKRGNERGSRAGQSDRKGVGRSRGQGETVSHRPAESGELSGSLYTLSFSRGRMHLGAAAEADCGRRTGQERERERGREKGAAVTACVSGAVPPPRWTLNYLHLRWCTRYTEYPEKTRRARARGPGDPVKVRSVQLRADARVRCSVKSVELIGSMIRRDDRHARWMTQAGTYSRGGTIETTRLRPAHRRWKIRDTFARESGARQDVSLKWKSLVEPTRANPRCTSLMAEIMTEQWRSQF